MQERVRQPNSVDQLFKGKHYALPAGKDGISELPKLVRLLEEQSNFDFEDIAKRLSSSVFTTPLPTKIIPLGAYKRPYCSAFRTYASYAGFNESLAPPSATRGAGKR